MVKWLGLTACLMCVLMLGVHAWSFEQLFCDALSMPVLCDCTASHQASLNFPRDRKRERAENYLYNGYRPESNLPLALINFEKFFLESPSHTVQGGRGSVSTKAEEGSQSSEWAVFLRDYMKRIR